MSNVNNRKDYVDMFNVTVLKMRDIIKYFLVMILTILIILIISKVINKENKEEKIINDVTKTVTSVTNQNFVSCLDTTIPVIEQLNHQVEIKEKNKKSNNTFLEQFIGTQISAIKTINEMDDVEENSNEESNWIYIN